MDKNQVSVSITGSGKEENRIVAEKVLEIIDDSLGKRLKFINQYEIVMSIKDSNLPNPELDPTVFIRHYQVSIFNFI